MVIYNASVFVALVISYLELLALPKKKKYVEHVIGAASAPSTRPASISSADCLTRLKSNRRPAKANPRKSTSELVL